MHQDPSTLPRVEAPCMPNLIDVGACFQASCSTRRSEEGSQQIPPACPPYLEKKTRAGASASKVPLFAKLFLPLLSHAGSPEERGIRKWKKGTGKGSKAADGMETYDLPFGMEIVKKYRCFAFLPISPTFMGYSWKGLRKRSNGRSSEEDSEATV